MRKIFLLVLLVLALSGCNSIDQETHEVHVYPMPHETFKASYQDNENGKLVKRGEVNIERYVSMIDKIIIYTIYGEEIVLKHGEDYLMITVVPKTMIEG
jgi:uncharacterized protein YceK